MNGIPRVAIALAALLALCLLLPACGGQEPVPRLPALSSDARILAFGDSLTSGSGAGNAESYPAVLSELLGHEVINAGNPGELSASGLDRITSVLERERPDLLLLCHGGNDLLRGRSTERLAANLAAMIRAARDRDIPVILIGVPARAWPIRTADVYRDVAADAGVPLEDSVVARILRDESLRADPIHPNAAGYRKLAEAVHDLLIQAGAVKPVH